jgi:hypothetical protein
MAGSFYRILASWTGLHGNSCKEIYHRFLEMEQKFYGVFFFCPLFSLPWVNLGRRTGQPGRSGSGRAGAARRGCPPLIRRAALESAAWLAHHLSYG